MKPTPIGLPKGRIEFARKSPSDVQCTLLNRGRAPSGRLATSSPAHPQRTRGHHADASRAGYPCGLVLLEHSTARGPAPGSVIRVHVVRQAHRTVGRHETVDEYYSPWRQRVRARCGRWCGASCAMAACPSPTAAGVGARRPPHVAAVSGGPPQAQRKSVCRAAFLRG